MLNTCFEMCCCCCCLATQSPPTLCNPMAGLPVPHHRLEFAQVHVHCINDAVSLLILWSPLLLPSIFPSIRNFSSELSVHIRWPNTGVSASVSVLPLNIQGWSPSDWLVWSPCCPRDFLKSFPAPQFEGINSLEFCLLHGPALTTICDQWEDNSLDYLDLCRHSNVSAFQHTV